MFDLLLAPASPVAARSRVAPASLPVAGATQNWGVEIQTLGSKGDPMQYDGLQQWWRAHVRRLRWWMNALMYFSMFMAVIALPRDFFCTPVARDDQVWFGIMLHGWAAKLGELAHWAVYAAAAYGFWRMRSWMWPGAALYAGQVTFSMFIWFAVH